MMLGFSLSSEQQSFLDTIVDFFKQECPPERAREFFEEKKKSDTDLWNSCLGLGLVEALWGASTTGVSAAGSGFVELTLVAEAAGGALLPLSLAEYLLAGAYLADRLTLSDAERSALATGGARAALAISRRASEAPAVVRGGDECRFVLVVDGRHHVVRLVRRETDAGACAAFSGEVLDRTQTAGTVRAAAGAEQPGLPALLVVNLVAILRAAEIMGCVNRVVSMTAEYVKTRTQFGVAVGGFQAVQHRLADMYLQAEALRSLVRFAAWSVVNDPAQVNLAAQAAIRQAVTTGPDIVEAAIQLHGGIGFTWEYDLHLLLRRVKAIEADSRLAIVDADALIAAAR